MFEWLCGRGVPRPSATWKSIKCKTVKLSHLEFGAILGFCCYCCCCCCGFFFFLFLVNASRLFNPECRGMESVNLNKFCETNESIILCVSYCLFAMLWTISTLCRLLLVWLLQQCLKWFSSPNGATVSHIGLGCGSKGTQFTLIVTTFPVSAIANVAKTHFRHTNQSAWIAVRTIFTWLQEATMRMQSTRWPWATRTIWIAAQIRAHFYSRSFLLFRLSVASATDDNKIEMTREKSQN